MKRPHQNPKGIPARRRSLAAHALANTLYRRRVKPSKARVYIRKPKHPNKGDET